jgi:hypothetical protein
LIETNEAPGGERTFDQFLAMAKIFRKVYTNEHRGAVDPQSSGDGSADEKCRSFNVEPLRVSGGNALEEGSQDRCIINRRPGRLDERWRETLRHRPQHQRESGAFVHRSTGGRTPPWGCSPGWGRQLSNRSRCRTGEPAGGHPFVPSSAPHSSVQPQELTSRTMTPLPVSMWVVQGMHGSKLRMARRTSMPLTSSSETDSRMGVSTIASS